ncbi:polysaccharide deacetylase family protein [Chloroflexota bacterium]
MRTAAVIATTLVIVTGFAMIIPLFLRPGIVEPKQRVMISFSVLPSSEANEWCQNLSSLLNAQDIGASVFFVGKVAEQYPQAVSYFSDKVDVGSQTYSNLDLTGTSDYSVKLQEIKEGKMAVDNAGNLYSRVFRAPLGATDEDIYSLLNQSGILADFSYKIQYNVYQNGQFVKYDAAVYEARDYPPDFFPILSQNMSPAIIVVDNSYSVSDIATLISALKKADVEFVNASELTGLTLTIRGGGFVDSKIDSN